MDIQEARKLQGKTFRVKRGALKGLEGVLGGLAKYTGSLKMLIGERLHEVWLWYEDMELVQEGVAPNTCGDPVSQAIDEVREPATLTLAEKLAKIDWGDIQVYDVLAAIRGPDQQTEIATNLKQLFTNPIRTKMSGVAWYSGVTISIAKSLYKERRSISLEYRHYLNHIVAAATVLEMETFRTLARDFRAGTVTEEAILRVAAESGWCSDD
ncbi:hypothetical protein LCGC14_0410110 [marine sediment metagenome]|uniref:Uncharacterized protein n=1 Tax=marine sediment metagenome TaxID=412755 RepID=A0A0F9TC33_9ZZZZ